MADNCSWCSEPFHKRQGRIGLCAMHYRISNMRGRARRDGKFVPTKEQIEALVPKNMECPACHRTMTWLRVGGASQQISLQHDRDGQLRLLCLGCNTRHSVHKGDSFYDIPPGHKFCAQCGCNKPLEQFSIDRSRPIGRKAYCKPCASVRHKIWRNAHAA